MNGQDRKPGMSRRGLIIIVVRLMALWLFFSALQWLFFGLYSVLQVFSPRLGAGPFSQRMLVDAGLATTVGVFAALAVSIALFLFAPVIARFVDRDSCSDEEAIAIEGVGPGDFYHIACFGLGIYVFVQAIDPFIHGLFGLLAVSSVGLQNQTVAMFVKGVILLALGTGLVFGARGIAACFARLGHELGNIPAQQFSLRMILILVIGIAILLAIIRATVR